MLPLSLELKAAACLVLLAGLWLGFHNFVKSEQAKGVATCEASHVESDRIEEQRRITAQAEIANESQRMENRRMADAVGLAAAGDGLRNRVAAAIGPGISASAAADCKAATEANRVLADLLGKADGRLRFLAATADASYDAGLSCERSYDSLTTSAHPTTAIQTDPPSE